MADEKVMLGHGSGGSMMKRIIDEVFFEAYGTDELLRGDDAAVLPALAPGERIAYSTDSFVVTPHFFPGGDIGRLAVCGTVNDVATSGARPLYLSCAFILEEGFPMDDLRRICASMAEAAREAGVAVEVLPGASAAACAYVASGTVCPRFYFGGFFPRKVAEQRSVLEELRSLDAALVFYESPNRLVAALSAIAEVLPWREVAVCRELTKLHEEVLRLPADELAANLAARDAVKGEIALVIAPPDVRAQRVASLDDPALRERIAVELAAGTPKSALAKQLARELGLPKNKLYDLILGM